MELDGGAFTLALVDLIDEIKSSLLPDLSFKNNSISRLLLTNVTYASAF